MVAALCRTCAQPSDRMIPIFDGNPSPATMLRSCTKISLNFRDDLPKTICEACSKRAADAYDFGSIALKAQATLQAAAEKPKTETKPDAGRNTIRILPRPQAKSSPFLKVSPMRRCNLCNVNFQTSSALTRHNLDVHFRTNSNKTHPCDVCKKIFKHKYLLLRHKKSIHEKEQTQQGADTTKNCNVCEFCNRGFRDEESLRRHISVRTSNECSFECVACGKLFPVKKDLQTNRETNHHGQVFFCSGCSAVQFNSVDDLLKHMQSDRSNADNVLNENNVHDLILGSLPDQRLAISTSEMKDKISEQGDFDKKFIITYYIEDGAVGDLGDAIDKLSEIDAKNDMIPSESNLSLEDIEVLNNKINLDIEKKKGIEPFEVLPPQASGESLTNKDSENYILMDITCKDNPNLNVEDESEPKSKSALNMEGKKLFQPTLPSQSTLSSIVKPKNNDESQSKEKEVFSPRSPSQSTACKICGKQFVRLFNLQLHMMKHQNEPLVCLGCKFTAGNKNSLKQHVQRCLMLRKFGNMICSICGKKLTSGSGFRKHIEMHSEDKKYECLRCRKLFRNTATLSSHIRTVHSTYRPYRCQSCPKAFASNNHLNKHVLSAHQADRYDHVCHWCGKKYAQRSHLTQHTWIHTGVKPHPCPYCPNRYTSKSALTKHLSRHHQPPNAKKKVVEPKAVVRPCDVAGLSDLNDEADQILDENDKPLDEIDDLDQYEVLFVVQDGDCLSF